MGWDIYAYGNRIDKLGKMVWYQFSTIVLQITILGIGDWHRTRAKRVNSQKKIPQKGKGEEFYISSRMTKDKSFQTVQLSIWT